MGELLENKQEELKMKLELDLSEIEELLCGINNCTDRLKRLIVLKAPMFTVKREIEMIQYRAGVLGMYECWALLLKDEQKAN